MSGPKVVRIVTREEVIAICEGLLAQLREAVRQWEKTGIRNDLLGNEEIEGTRKRLAQIEALLREDRWLELQKQVPAEVHFLKEDMARRLDDAAKRAADARVRKRRLATLAGQKLNQAAQGAYVLPNDLRQELEAIAGGEIDEKRAEPALAKALALSIVSPEAPTVTAEQRALAEQLRGKEQSATIADWIARNPSEAEVAHAKVDTAIADLQVAGASEQAAAFAARHRTILDDASSARQNMLLDTLILDIGKAVLTIRERAKQLGVLSEQAAQLAAIDSSAARSLVERAEIILAHEDATEAATLIPEVLKLIASERKALATAARRRALLSALAELGYEVREGMQTAWAKEGRVVMRRAANPEMGVQITGAHETERLQFRPVRFGAPGSSADRGRDRDIETLWCSDFDKLHKRLQSEQGKLVIEKALPVGAVEVLFVAEDEGGASRRPDVVTPLKTRSL